MISHVVRRAALSSLALAICPLFAQAQNAAEPAVAAVLVTATRTPQPAADVLADHLVLSSEDIVRSGAGNVVDLLQQQRGIEVARNGGPGTNASVFMRGGDSKQTVVLVDGVRIGSSSSGIANWSALPLANIDRIEIIYGPLATMYGADAIGGVVQVFTKRGTGPARYTASASAGSKGMLSADQAVAGATDRVSYGFSLSHEQDEGFSATKPGNFSYNPDDDGYRKQAASGTLSYALADGHEAGLLFMHSKLDAQYDAGASSYDARSEQQLDNLALFSTHQLSAGWRVRLQASVAYDQSANLANATPSGTSSIDTRINAYSAQSDLSLGPDLLQLLLERRSETVTTSATPALNRTRDTNSAAVAYSLRRGAHIASASARIDDSSQYGSASTGGLAYGLRIGRSLRLSASAGSSFRAPTFNELYYPSYGVASNRPEHGRNAEAGIAYNSGDTELTAVYYRNRMTNLLVSTSRCPIEVASHPFGCAYNVNQATMRGLSIGAATRLGGVGLHASADLQDPRDDTTGKQLVRRARRHGALSIDYGMGALTTGAILQVSGKRFDDTANRNSLGGYGIVNLFAEYRFAPDWSATLRWNNAANKRYELARTYASAGSQVFAGIRFGAR